MKPYPLNHFISLTHSVIDGEQSGCLYYRKNDFRIHLFDFYCFVYFDKNWAKHRDNTVKPHWEHSSGQKVWTFYNKKKLQDMKFKSYQEYLMEKIYGNEQ